MFHLLLLFYTLFEPFIHYIKNGLYLPISSQSRILENYYKYGEFFLNWSYQLYLGLSITDRNMNSNYNKMVFMANHSNFLDAYMVPVILKKVFPEHKQLFITKYGYSKLPVIGKFLKTNHILLKNNLQEDIQTIKNIAENCYQNNEKIIIIIFPEGKLRYNESIEKSIKWCNKNNLPQYYNCLAPRTNGIYTLLKYFQPDYIIQGLLKYDNDSDGKGRFKGVYYSDFIYGNFPNKLNISLELRKNKFNIENLKIFEEQFYHYWKINVDKKLFCNNDSILTLD